MNPGEVPGLQPVFCDLSFLLMYVWYSTSCLGLSVPDELVKNSCCVDSVGFYEREIVASQNQWLYIHDMTIVLCASHETRVFKNHIDTTFHLMKCSFLSEQSFYAPPGKKYTEIRGGKGFKIGVIKSAI